MFPSQFRLAKRPMIVWPFSVSRFPVGSSANLIAGDPAIARATATRCCWPPESSQGLLSTNASMPTRSKAKDTRLARSLDEKALRNVRGSATLSLTESSPIKLKFWNIKPISALRILAFSPNDILPTSLALNWYDPPVNSSSSLRIERSVLLPEPDGPVGPCVCGKSRQSMGSKRTVSDSRNNVFLSIRCPQGD